MFSPKIEVDAGDRCPHQQDPDGRHAAGKLRSSVQLRRYRAIVRSVPRPPAKPPLPGHRTTRYGGKSDALLQRRPDRLRPVWPASAPSRGEDVHTDTVSELRRIGTRPEHRGLLQLLRVERDLLLQRCVHRMMVVGVGAQHRGHLLRGPHLAVAGEDRAGGVRVLGHPFLRLHDRGGECGGDRTLVANQAGADSQYAAGAVGEFAGKIVGHLNQMVAVADDRGDRIVT